MHRLLLYIISVLFSRLRCFSDIVCSHHNDILTGESVDAYFRPFLVSHINMAMLGSVYAAVSSMFLYMGLICGYTVGFSVVHVIRLIWAVARTAVRCMP